MRAFLIATWRGCNCVLGGIVSLEAAGGEGGIRTPGARFSGCNCLAGSPVQPLQHLSAACNCPTVRHLPAIHQRVQGDVFAVVARALHKVNEERFLRRAERVVEELVTA